MQRVWSKLTKTIKRKELKHTARAKTKESYPPIRTEAVRYETVDPNKQLVTAHDEHLVTPFTFYTMLQVRPCNLENSGNGSRSAFDYGFPGLECIHCAGFPNSRRFFYRTSEILGGK